MAAGKVLLGPKSDILGCDCVASRFYGVSIPALVGVLSATLRRGSDAMILPPQTIDNAENVFRDATNCYFFRVGRSKAIRRKLSKLKELVLYVGGLPKGLDKNDYVKRLSMLCNKRGKTSYSTG